jgi:hypothetical protein
MGVIFIGIIIAIAIVAAINSDEEEDKGIYEDKRHQDNKRNISKDE